MKQILFALLIVPILMFVYTLCNGFVLFHLWNWFVVPLSSSVPVLSILHFAGLYLLFIYISRRFSTKKKATTKKDLPDLTEGQFIFVTRFEDYIRLGVILVCGYIIQHFM